jgi:predicted nucleic acid-binding Zn ribbon protein
MAPASILFLVRFSRRARQRSGEPESAATLVNAVVGRIGGDARALEHRVFEAYNATVGALLRQRTSPEKLRGSMLFVRVGSSAIAHQVALLKRDLLAGLAANLGPGVVTDLRTRVGPLPAG